MNLMKIFDKIVTKEMGGRNMLLDDAFAEKFIKKLKDYTNYNVNVMNQKGIIIASRNPERVGRFHEIAFDMILKHKDVIEVSEKEDYLGVKPGINLAVVCQGEWLGVVGVTGKPDEVRSIALLIKMALETMLEYELKRDQILKRQNLKEQFFNLLLYDEQPDQMKLRDIAGKLGYNENYLRIPILCVPDGEDEELVNQEELLKQIKADRRHTYQDISFLTQEKKILIFKTLPQNSRILADYKYLLEEYLEIFKLKGKQNYKFYIGTVQDQFINYKSA